MPRGDHWEPPEGRKLLVTSHRVAEVLDVPQWKAHELCHVLERVFYTKGMHYRVTTASLEALRELLEQGVPLETAREVMWQYKRRGSLPAGAESVGVALRGLTARSRRRLRW